MPWTQAKTSQPAKSTATDPAGTTDGGAQQRERTPWLLGFLCFLIPVLPTYVVLPGPLKSNGSPARIIAVMLFGLVALGFVMLRRTAHTPRVSPGAIILLAYFSMLWLTTYGVGLVYHDRSPGWSAIAPTMDRSLISLIANVGVGLYILTRVRSARQRNIVLGCLAVGLAFACLVGLLQGITSIDLRFFFRPPGFVLNADDLPVSERVGVNRATGTSQHPIEFSILATVALPLTIYFARHAATKNVRWLSAAACGLGILAMPTAVARSGVLALIAALLILMFALRVREIALGVTVGSLAVGGYILAFPHIANALWVTITNSREDPSVHGRTEDYAVVSQTFSTHPLFGLGLGGSPPTEARVHPRQSMATVNCAGRHRRPHSNDAVGRRRHLRNRCRTAQRCNSARTRSGLHARIDVGRFSGRQLHFRPFRLSADSSSSFHHLRLAMVLCIACSQNHADRDSLLPASVTLSARILTCVRRRRSQLDVLLVQSGEGGQPGTAQAANHLTQSRGEGRRFGGLDH